MASEGQKLDSVSPASEELLLDPERPRDSDASSQGSSWEVVSSNGADSDEGAGFEVLAGGGQGKRDGEGCKQTEAGRVLSQKWCNRLCHLRTISDEQEAMKERGVDLYLEMIGSELKMYDKILFRIHYYRVQLPNR